MNCPKCGQHFVTIIDPTGQRNAPTIGDPMVCGQCAAYLIVETQTVVRLATIDEVQPGHLIAKMYLEKLREQNRRIERHQNN